MKRSLISLCVAGLFAGSAMVVFAADNTETDVKATPKQVETSQSRSSDPNTKDAINDTSADAKQDKTTAADRKTQDKTAADFRKADKDNDGTLDRKEAKKMRGVNKNFDAMDADKDGTVSMEEIDTWMAAHPDHKGKM
jgi:Ca2+-binding EF-hand superfamily protein